MKCVLIAAMSADGNIGESHDQLSLDWTSKEDTRFFISKTKEIGVVVMGARTFKTIGKPLPGRRTIVMSKDEDALPRFPIPDPDIETGTLEYANMPIPELVQSLEEQGVERLVVAGGSSIYSQFLQEGLVTDLYLSVEPILFGSGVPLATGFDRIEMRLIDSIMLGDKTVLLHYQI